MNGEQVIWQATTWRRVRKGDGSFGQAFKGAELSQSALKRRERESVCVRV